MAGERRDVDQDGALGAVTGDATAPAAPVVTGEATAPAAPDDGAAPAASAAPDGANSSAPANLETEGINLVSLTLNREPVSSYGSHRFSHTTRLTIAFAVCSLLTVAIMVAILYAVWLRQGVQFTWTEIVALALGAAVAIIFATVLGRFSARGVTNPLRHITSTLQSYSLDKMDARTGFTGYDEIGRLGRTIDEMADALEKARKYERQITVDIAHELRTPLMAIQATLEAMIDQVMPADEEHLLTLHSEALRLSRLVEAQLKLSRLETRRVVVNAVEIDVGKDVGQLLLSYTTLIEDMGLHLETRFDPNVHVLADPDLLHQALANLISNAVRYTPANGALSVRVSKNDSMAQISVADTGMGIATEDAGKIFEKFYRVDDGRNREQGGLGIGLAMVKEIAEIHGGRASVVSAPGEGSIFTIELPLLERRLWG
ncbi:MAG: HAMP domain-containing histidine kinase [Coriobacteriales bacterium]|jgi:signal transduction histidine kinase|nr:HAMP domain-containing histidine kinase [Coriobacteriales bacterium]